LAVAANAVHPSHGRLGPQGLSAQAFARFCQRDLAPVKARATVRPAG
jgi:hypothetical protein